MRQDRIDSIVSIMSAIGRMRSVRAPELADVTKISPSAIHQVLTYLSEHKYVSVAKEARRKWHYSLTEAGLHYLATLKDQDTQEPNGKTAKALFGTRICVDRGMV
jgi:DNA-binding MarR family transcriptional regulator